MTTNNEILKNHNSFIGPSFTLKNRFFRIIWSIVSFFFFKLCPRPFHAWRIIILKLFGAKIGVNCRIHRNVKIWAPWNLIVGNNVSIADNVNLVTMDKIQIKDFVNISDGTYLCCGSHNYKSKNFELYTKSIILEKYVWICAESFIHPGVTISEGIVVGARSVVNKNLNNKYTVYSGNPCKKIKKYFRKV